MDWASRGVALERRGRDREALGYYRQAVQLVPKRVDAFSDAVEAAWLSVYRKPEQHWDLYQLGEELTDLEDALRLWRFRHVTTVERIIGGKRGTGGTAGAAYLQGTVAKRAFPELWSLRTEL